MTDNIIFLFSNKAHKQLKKLPRTERIKIEHSIREKVYGFLSCGDSRYLMQDHYFSKMGSFDSTIYYIKLDLHKRAIISVDEDPIFEKAVINIYSICNHDHLEREIRGIMESLYQKMINPTSCKKEDSE